MAKNTVLAQDDVITIAAPANVTSGGVVVAGKFIGVALSSASSGEQVAIALRGVFTLPKTNSQQWTLGAPLYWDAATGFVTATAGTLPFIGLAAAAYANTAGIVLGDVYLCQGVRIEADLIARA